LFDNRRQENPIQQVVQSPSSQSSQLFQEVEMVEANQAENQTHNQKEDTTRKKLFRDHFLATK